MHIQGGAEWDKENLSPLCHLFTKWARSFRKVLMFLFKAKAKQNLHLSSFENSEITIKNSMHLANELKIATKRPHSYQSVLFCAI